MEEPLQVRDDVIIPGAELWFTASRSGGPGGQHVNKTNSRVTLHWDAVHTTALTELQKERVMARLASRLSQEGVLAIDVDAERSQHRNKEIARERLAAIVLQALRLLPPRIPTKASRSAKRRRVEEKVQRGAIKRGRKRPGSDD